MNKKKLSETVAKVAEIIYNGTDGKKTISGIVALVGGIVTLILTPESETATALISAGLITLITGLVHKARKAQ